MWMRPGRHGTLSTRVRRRRGRQPPTTAYRQVRRESSSLFTLRLCTAQATQRATHSFADTGTRSHTQLVQSLTGPDCGCGRDTQCHRVYAPRTAVSICWRCCGMARPVHGAFPFGWRGKNQRTSTHPSPARASSNSSWQAPLLATIPRTPALILAPPSKRSVCPRRSVTRPPASSTTMLPAAWSQMFSW